MKPEQAHGPIRLTCGDTTIEVDALFDTGSARSIISVDLAVQLAACYFRLPPEQQYPIGTAKQGAAIQITAQVRANVNLSDCRVPSTPFEVSPNLPPKRLIIGRTQIDEWDIEFTPDGPRPRTCPPMLEAL